MSSEPQSLQPEKSTTKREPRGFIATYSIALYGITICIMMPALGGLSIRLQDINHGNLATATAQLSIVSGIGVLFALFSQPLFGRLSDRTSGKIGMRRPWIFIGVIGAGVTVSCIGIAPNMMTLLILWCLAQTFSNMAQATITATLPDQVPTNRRGIVSGVSGACSPLGMLTGAALLAVFSNDIARFMIPGILSILLGLVFVFTLKDRTLEDKQNLPPLSVKEFLGSFVFNPRKDPDLVWDLLSKAFIMFGYASVGTYLTLFLAAKYGMNTNEQTKFNLYANIASISLMVVISILGGRLSDQLKRRRIFVAVSGFIIAAGTVLLAFSPLFGHDAGLVLIIIAEGIIGAGGGLFFAVDMAMCTEVLPNSDDTAKDLGVLNIANTLPNSIAPFMANGVIAAVGSAGFTVWFCIGAAVAVLGGVTVTKVKGVK